MQHMIQYNTDSRFRSNSMGLGGGVIVYLHKGRIKYVGHLERGYLDGHVFCALQQFEYGECIDYGLHNSN